MMPSDSCTAVVYPLPPVYSSLPQLMWNWDRITHSWQQGLGAAGTSSEGRMTLSKFSYEGMSTGTF